MFRASTRNASKRNILTFLLFLTFLDLKLTSKHEDHISNQYMQLFVLFINSNTLHVSGVTRPSSGAQELCVQPMVLSY